LLFRPDPRDQGEPRFACADKAQRAGFRNDAQRDATGVVRELEVIDEEVEGRRFGERQASVKPAVEVDGRSVK
jgi:hypothetical protein